MFDGNHVSDMLWNQNFNFVDLVLFDAKLFSSSKDLRALHDQFIKKLISACGIESSKRVNCYMLQPSLNRCRPKQPGLKKSLYPHRWQGAGMPDCFSWKSGLLSHFWSSIEKYGFSGQRPVPSRVWTLTHSEAWQQPLNCFSLGLPPVQCSGSRTWTDSN